MGEGRKVYKLSYSTRVDGGDPSGDPNKIETERYATESAARHRALNLLLDGTAIDAWIHKEKVTYVGRVRL